MTTKSPLELEEFNRVLRSSLLLPVGVLALLAGLLVWHVRVTLEVQNAVDHGYRVISQLNRLDRLAVDQQTGLRAYELTALPATLQPYNAAQPSLGNTLQALKALTAGDAGDTRRIAAIDQTLSEWTRYSANDIEQTSRGVRRDPVASLQGTRAIDSLRLQIADMVKSETAQRESLSDRVHSRITRFFSVVLGLALLSGIAIGLFIRRRMKLVSSTYDVTLHHLQERNEELFSSQQLLLTTLQSIGDAVISCDPEGKVLFMNAVAQQLTGWTISEAEGKPVNQVLQLSNELTRQPVADLLAEVKRANSLGLANQSVLMSRDGTELAIDHTTAPVRMPHSEKPGAVIVFRDVTEMRRAEATLIANEKLAVTGRLAASIAHEIHNPLDSVSNLHFLLSNERDPQKSAEYLALAQQELARTLQISRAMLSLYRESQVPVRVDLKELIGSVLLLLDRKLKDQEIAIEQIYTQPTEVEGYPGELRQVFTNLVANASEAAGARGRVRVQVRPASPQDGRAGVLVEISDSGPGIAPHVERKLFQPFITTKGERGTGLGLWVSLGIVQKHGGTVRISNSSQGELRGAIVRVYLPEKSMASQAVPAPLN